MSNRLVRDLAAGKTPMYASAPDQGLSPAEAARVLGVSRQFVDRAIATGKIAHSHKPGSSHRLIAVSELDRFAAERVRRRDSVNQAIDALREGGLEY
jgi:excisionase family DNA binding protein